MKPNIEAAREHEKAIDDAAQEYGNLGNINTYIAFQCGARFGFILGQASMQGEIDKQVKLKMEAIGLYGLSENQLTQRDAAIKSLNEMVGVMEKTLSKCNSCCWDAKTEVSYDDLAYIVREALTKISELRKKL